MARSQCWCFKFMPCCSGGWLLWFLLARGAGRLGCLGEPTRQSRRSAEMMPWRKARLHGLVSHRLGLINIINVKPILPTDTIGMRVSATSDNIKPSAWPGVLGKHCPLRLVPPRLMSRHASTLCSTGLGAFSSYYLVTTCWRPENSFFAHGLPQATVRDALLDYSPCLWPQNRPWSVSTCPTYGQLACTSIKSIQDIKWADAKVYASRYSAPHLS